MPKPSKIHVEFTRDRLVVLREGQKPLKVSISKFPPLAKASMEERGNYTVDDDCSSVSWPSLAVNLRLDSIK